MTTHFKSRNSASLESDPPYVAKGTRTVHKILLHLLVHSTGGDDNVNPRCFIKSERLDSSLLQWILKRRPTPRQCIFEVTALPCLLGLRLEYPRQQSGHRDLIVGSLSRIPSSNFGISIHPTKAFIILQTPMLQTLSALSLRVILRLSS